MAQLSVDVDVNVKAMGWQSDGQTAPRDPPVYTTVTNLIEALDTSVYRNPNLSLETLVKYTAETPRARTLLQDVNKELIRLRQAGQLSGQVNKVYTVNDLLETLDKEIHHIALSRGLIEPQKKADLITILEAALESEAEGSITSLRDLAIHYRAGLTTRALGNMLNELMAERAGALRLVRGVTFTDWTQLLEPKDYLVAHTNGHLPPSGQASVRIATAKADIAAGNALYTQMTGLTLGEQLPRTPGETPDSQAQADHDKLMAHLQPLTELEGRRLSEFFPGMPRDMTLRDAYLQPERLSDTQWQDPRLIEWIGNYEAATATFLQTTAQTHAVSPGRLNPLRGDILEKIITDKDLALQNKDWQGQAGALVADTLQNILIGSATNLGIAGGGSVGSIIPAAGTFAVAFGGGALAGLMAIPLTRVLARVLFTATNINRSVSEVLGTIEDDIKEVTSTLLGAGFGKAVEGLMGEGFEQLAEELGEVIAEASSEVPKYMEMVRNNDNWQTVAQTIAEDLGQSTIEAGAMQVLAGSIKGLIEGLTGLDHRDWVRPDPAMQTPKRNRPADIDTSLGRANDLSNPSQTERAGNMHLDKPVHVWPQAPPGSLTGQHVIHVLEDDARALTRRDDGLYTLNAEGMSDLSQVLSAQFGSVPVVVDDPNGLQVKAKIEMYGRNQFQLALVNSDWPGGYQRTGQSMSTVAELFMGDYANPRIDPEGPLLVREQPLISGQQASMNGNFKDNNNANVNPTTVHHNNPPLKTFPNNYNNLEDRVQYWSRDAQPIIEFLNTSPGESLYIQFILKPKNRESPSFTDGFIYSEPNGDVILVDAYNREYNLSDPRYRNVSALFNDPISGIKVSTEEIRDQNIPPELLINARFIGGQAADNTADHHTIYHIGEQQEELLRGVPDAISSNLIRASVFDSNSLENISSARFITAASRFFAQRMASGEVKNADELWQDTRAARLELAQRRSETPNIFEDLVSERKAVSVTPIQERYEFMGPLVGELSREIQQTPIGVPVHRVQLYGEIDGEPIPVSLLAFPATKDRRSIHAAQQYQRILTDAYIYSQINQQNTETALAQLRNNATSGIVHTDPQYFPKIWRHIENLYERAMSPEIQGEELLTTLARIQWWGSQMSRDIRGSATKVETFIYSIMWSRDITPQPWMEGISIDLEALFSNEDSFISNYRNYFLNDPLAP